MANLGLSPSLRGVAVALLLAVPSFAVAAVSGHDDATSPSENLMLYGEGWHLDADGNGIDDRLDAAGVRGDASPVLLHLHYSRGTTAADEARVEQLTGSDALRFDNWDDIEVVARATDATLLRALPGVLSIERVPFAELAMNVAALATRARPVATVVGGFDHNLAVHSTLGFKGEGMVIAILDTGVDNRHSALDDLDDNPATFDPKLVQKVVNGQTIYGGADTAFSGAQYRCIDPADDHGHGTHVAGIAAGTNLHGNGGVAPAARIVDIKIGVGGSSAFGQMTSALDWVMSFNAGTSCYGDPGDDRIDVASLSFTADPDPRGSLSRKMTDIARSGVVFVIAAGNDGPVPRSLAGGPEGAIIVANSDDRNSVTRADDAIASTSSRGPRNADGDADTADELRPDIAAPGSNILAPARNTANGYVSFSGTSMAAPHISGIAALMLQANPGIRPIDLGSNERMGDEGAVLVRDMMQQAAESKDTRFPDIYETTGRWNKPWNSEWGYGLVDAYASVAAALAYTPAPDLHFSLIGIPPRVYLDDAVDMRAHVTNRGPAPAPATTIRFTIDGATLAELPVPALASGATYVATSPMWTATPGYHAVRIAVDPAGAEVNVANNVFDSVIGTREVVHVVLLPQTGLVNAGTSIFHSPRPLGAVEVRIECKFTDGVAGFVSTGPEGREIWACAQNQRALIPQVELDAGNHQLWFEGRASAPITIEVSGVRG